MRGTRNRWLAIGSVALAAGSIYLWMMLDTAGWSNGHAITATLAGILLLQLPALGLRARGGALASVAMPAAAIPMIVLEGFLLYSAATNEGRGGDLQGVEYVLMGIVVMPIILMTLLVSVAALCLMPRNAPPE